MQRGRTRPSAAPEASCSDAREDVEGCGCICSARERCKRDSPSGSPDKPLRKFHGFILQGLEFRVKVLCSGLHAFAGATSVLQHSLDWCASPESQPEVVSQAEAWPTHSHLLSWGADGRALQAAQASVGPKGTTSLGFKVQGCGQLRPLRTVKGQGYNEPFAGWDAGPHP